MELIVFERRFINRATTSLSDDSVSLTIRSFLAFLVPPLGIRDSFNVRKGRVWIDRLPHFLVKLKREAFGSGPALYCILSSSDWLSLEHFHQLLGKLRLLQWPVLLRIFQTRLYFAEKLLLVRDQLVELTLDLLRGPLRKLLLHRLKQLALRLEVLDLLVVRVEADLPHLQVDHKLELPLEYGGDMRLKRDTVVGIVMTHSLNERYEPLSDLPPYALDVLGGEEHVALDFVCDIDQQFFVGLLELSPHIGHALFDER